MAEETREEKLKRLREEAEIKRLEAEIAGYDKKPEEKKKTAETQPKKHGVLRRHWGKMLVTLGILAAIGHCTSDEKQTNNTGPANAPLPSAINTGNTTAAPEVEPPVFEGSATFVGTKTITGARGARMNVQFDMDGDGKADVQGEVSREFWRDVKSTTEPQTQEGWEKMGVYNFHRLGRD